MKILIVLFVVVVVVWTAWSFYSSNVETLSYEVLEKNENYEIRKYAPYIAMQIEIDEENVEDALGEGFKVLANYIFGGNQGNKSVAMTAPVLEMKKTKIAMTAPVLEQKSDRNRVITFTAPKKYTIDTLPKPNNEKITFVQIPEKKYAVYRFTWYYTAKKIEEKKKYFLELLKKDNKVVISEPMFAGYNAPGTIPFLMRNEILIEIK